MLQEIGIIKKIGVKEIIILFVFVLFANVQSNLIIDELVLFYTTSYIQNAKH